MTGRRWFFILALAAASSAHAAGFYFGENGSRALLQGGAFTGQADDLSAIQHNPAGLSQLTGFQFLLDSMVLSHDVRFLRKDAVSPAPNEVSNSGGLFYLPNLGLGYGLKLAGRPLTFAVGAYGPPSVGRYAFPRPNYTTDPPEETSRYLENPKKFAPQRYALIASDVIILYPSLSASYAPHSRVSLGASFQYVYSKLSFSQALYTPTLSGTPGSMREEGPEYDSVVGVDLAGKGGFTGIFGVLVRPTDTLSVGASVRPPVPVSARGDFIMTPGQFAQSVNAEVLCPDRRQDGATVVCPNAADLTLQLPWEARLGVHYRPLSRLGLNLDFVYQGWQSMREIVLTPHDIRLSLAGVEQEVEAFAIPKRWHKAVSVRAGGSYQFSFGLTAYAGALFEESAMANEYTNIDFLHFTRTVLTLGAGYRVGPIDLILGGAYTPTQTKEIAESAVRAGSTDPALEGGVIGTGTYTSGGWITTLGVRGRFGGEP